jgi:hypothetical protein
MNKLLFIMTFSTLLLVSEDIFPFSFNSINPGIKAGYSFGKNHGFVLMFEGGYFTINNSSTNYNSVGPVVGGLIGVGYNFGQKYSFGYTEFLGGSLLFGGSMGLEIPFKSSPAISPFLSLYGGCYFVFASYRIFLLPEVSSELDGVYTMPVEVQ